MQSTSDVVGSSAWALVGEGARVVVVASGSHRPGSMLPSVPAVVRSAEDLCKRLVAGCGLDEARLRLLINPAGPMEVGQALSDAAAEAGTLLLFYYIGHGLIGRRNELHLATNATMDLSAGLEMYQALPFSLVRDVLAGCAARSQVVFLDCCFSGRARGSFGDPARDGVELAGIEGGCLLASAAKEETALAPLGRRHTAFTGELLRLLRDGDPGGPAELTIDHVYSCLARVLPEQGFRVPHRQVAGWAGGLVLAPNAAWRPPMLEPRPRTPVKPVASAEVSCPYRGLASYGPADARYFHGRQELIDQVVARVVERVGRPRPLLIVGPSGSGKSSLVRAGVLPSVAMGALPFPGSFNWPSIVMSPGAKPVAHLASRLARPVDADSSRLRRGLPAKPSDVVDAVREVSSRAPGGPGARLLLVIDQFEELFTECVDEHERKVFVEALCAAASPRPDAGAVALVVLVVRADFYGQCAAYAGLIDSMQDGQVVVGAMAGAELREAIEMPAQLAGLALEPGLTDRLLEDLGCDLAEEDAGRLPLLSHALLGTWQQREDRLLTLAGYQATGGIRYAIAQTAERAYSGLTPLAQRAARDLLVRMVTVGRGTEDTRRHVPLADLLGEHAAPESRSALDAMVAARLVTTGDGAAEITHEALLKHWPRLREWIATDYTRLLTRQRLTDAATAWTEAGRDRSLLHRGQQLAAERAWTDDAQLAADLTPRERDFLQASLRHERRRARRLYAIIATLAALLLVATATSWYAFRQRNTAEQERRTALSSQMVAESGALADTNPAIALMLGTQAMRLDTGRAARNSLVQTIITSHYAGALPGGTGTTRAVAFSPDRRILAVGADDHSTTLWDLSRSPHDWLATLTGHTAAVRSLVFSPDGRILVTGGDDRVAMVWDISIPTRPRALTRLRGTGHILGLAFSPDGRTLVGGASDGTITLWDMKDPRRPGLMAHFAGHADAVHGVAYSTDGLVVATAGADGIIIVWDMTVRVRPVAIARLSGHEGPVLSVAFAPAAELLLTGSADRTAILWDLTGPWPRTDYSPAFGETQRRRPRRIMTLTGHTDAVYGVAFDRTGSVVATGSKDGTVILTDVSDPNSPTLLGRLAGQNNPVYSMAVSADSRQLVTTSGRTAELWDLTGLPLRQKSPLQGVATAAALRPDGRTLVVADRARTFAVSPQTPADTSISDALAASDTGGTQVLALAYSPNGQILAAAYADRSLTLAGPGDRRRATVLSRITHLAANINTVAFSPDSPIMAGAGSDGTVHLWDVSDPAHPLKLAALAQPGGAVNGLAFGSGHHILAAAGEDGAVWLWNVADPARPARLARLAGRGGAMRRVAFGPEGRNLATAGEDGAVALWDVANPARPVRLALMAAHGGPVNGIAFNPDGKILATAGDDRAATLWDITDPRAPTQLRRLVGYHSGVLLGGFSSDGRLLATASEGGTTFWDLGVVNDAVTNPIAVACRIAGPGLSRLDWAHYLPSVPYEHICD